MKKTESGFIVTARETTQSVLEYDVLIDDAQTKEEAIVKAKEAVADDELFCLYATVDERVVETFDGDISSVTIEEEMGVSSKTFSLWRSKGVVEIGFENLRKEDYEILVSKAESGLPGAPMMKASSGASLLVANPFDLDHPKKWNETKAAIVAELGVSFEYAALLSRFFASGKSYILFDRDVVVPEEAGLPVYDW